MVLRQKNHDWSCKEKKKEKKHFWMYICVCSPGQDGDRAETQDGNNLHPADKETQLARLSFPELGQHWRRNRIQDLYLRPNLSAEGQALKRAVSPIVNWTSVKLFTSNRWKPHGKRKHNKMGCWGSDDPPAHWFLGAPLLGSSHFSLLNYYY